MNGAWALLAPRCRSAVLASYVAPASPKAWLLCLSEARDFWQRNHRRTDFHVGNMLMKRKWDSLYLYDGPVAYVLVSDAAVRIHPAIEAGRSAGMPKSEFRPRNRWGSQMKIPPTIEPIAHISPYRRIDPSHPGRRRVITLDEWQASGSTRTPDPEIYSYDARNRRWVLKEGVR
jgi:hypothetical protein